MPKSYARKLRVAAELQRLLNELLRTEVRDPRLENVRVNEVELSGDLSVANVFFGTLQPDADPEPAREALVKAKGFLRSRVGKELRLRRAPELRFAHDESPRRGLELTRLLDELGSGSRRDDKSRG
jgi:ribosome-binding factor A